ncbi:hemin uptake protein HemP [Meridianimarinicoccus sp. RP-17]|uniref:hemin uptake protein HemP n=1 Tax=Meridianimarinicoccus zhengii TaxID=2056810 RepID=UPI000DAEE531|nr:hemin uptake protein HemP [Phycocomes zhengii]
MTLAFRAPDRQPDTADARPAPAGGAPVHDARHLTGPDQTGYIRLDDKTYVLRITRAGKLILTK